MKFLSILFFVIFSVGCQLSPTKISEESSGALKNIVFVDTRSALEFESFHLEGSIHLQTSDFLILQNGLSKNKKNRILDPDLKSIIQRLAIKGVHPERKIVLMGSPAKSVESLKWNWLLKQIDVLNVEMVSFEEAKKKYQRQIQKPISTDAWTLNTEISLVQETVFKKSNQCFVQWLDGFCQN